MANEHEERTTGQLFRELSDETATLLRQEVQLAKAEIDEKVSRLGKNLAYLAIGGTVAYIGILFLVLAITAGLWAGLEDVMGEEAALWLSPLIVGLVIGVVGYALLHKAIKTIKREGIAPRETVETMRENKEWLKHGLT